MAISETVGLAQATGFYSVVACWFAFFLSFGLLSNSKKGSDRAREAKRDHTAVLGILLQAVAYFMVCWGPLRRKQFVPARLSSPVMEWGLALLAMAIAVASVWLAASSCRRLGKQWAVGARLVEGHSLIQDGPYAFVRNPIYLSMFGMMLATGLLVTQWFALLVASLVLVAGTYIRVHTEERLLRPAFGVEFEKYAARVPAFLPGIW
jgi:protein-S-isoprenylcysteine O-methyltransferase Ste14